MFIFKTNFVTPFEVGVFHEGAIPELPLEQVVDLLLQDASEQDVELGEEVSGLVLILLGVQPIWLGFLNNVRY